MLVMYTLLADDGGKIIMKYGQWIPVTERLPEDGQECIIFDKVCGILCGTFNKWEKNSWEMDDSGCWQHIAGEDVTHWIPAPEEPNADKKEAGVLQTIYDTPETCPNCMEHLSLEWAYCPECGRPTDWSRRDCNKTRLLDPYKGVDNDMNFDTKDEIICSCSICNKSRLNGCNSCAFYNTKRKEENQ